MLPSHPLIDACIESYRRTPGVVRLRTDGPQARWAAELLRLAEREEVAPLRRTLTEIAQDGLQTLDPFHRFAADTGPTISSRQYAQASVFGAGQLRRTPGAAYAITLTALLGWSTTLGDRLAQNGGYPNRGWVEMPHAHAQAVLKLGDARRALRIVDTAYDVLVAARDHSHPVLVAAVADYRALAGVAGRRLEQAIDNLADDLARSGLRTHLMALMWTIGFVPECEGLRVTGQTPSRSMLRTLIRLSLDRIPQDPLTQYVWLEMKDKPPLDLRSHQFFPDINRRYDQYFPDAIWPTMPSEIYARTLIGWLDGSLGADDVAAYLDVIGDVRDFENVREHSPGVADWSVYLRMISLAYLLAGEYDMFAGEPTPEGLLESWRSLFGQVIGMRARHHLNPHRPDLEGTLNYPMFHLVEHLGDSAEVIHDLERYRAAAMSFSLAVTPPLTVNATAPALADHLDRERELIRALRGSYFLVNHQFLPGHFGRYYRRFGIDAPELGLDAGRRDYVEVERLLDELYEEMNTIAVEYTAVRRDPTADVDRITRALGQHRTAD